MSVSKRLLLIKGNTFSLCSRGEFSNSYMMLAGTLTEIALRWMPQYLTNEKSALVQVMVWWRQATSHYLSQYWPRFMSPYGITRPQWIKCCCFTEIISSSPRLFFLSLKRLTVNTYNSDKAFSMTVFNFLWSSQPLCTKMCVLFSIFLIFIYSNLMHIKYLLTHGPVTPYDIIDVGQHQLSCWLVPLSESILTYHHSNP